MKARLDISLLMLLVSFLFATLIIVRKISISNYSPRILQKNKFACEQCNQSGVCLPEDSYIPIEEAVEAVRNDVPSLMQLIRGKVDVIVKTRTELDSLLKKVDQENVSTISTG